MLKTFISAACALMALAAQAQPYSVSAQWGQSPTTTAEFVAPNIVRVTKAYDWQEQLPSRASVLTEADRPAGVDILSPDMMQSGTVTVILDPYHGSVTLTDSETGITVYDEGKRSLDDQGRQTISLSTGKPRAFFGAGERGHAPAFRGDKLVNYNRQNYGYTGSDPRISQMNITMPMVVGDDGLVIVFDDFMPSTLTADNTIEYVTENPNPVSYYVIFPSHENLMAFNSDASRRLADLTGYQPMPPLWAMGYITSKYGYHDAGETTGAIDTLKSQGYPVDGIVLDLYWYGKEQDMGRLAWEPTQWGDHRKMLSDLKDRGVNTVIITQPYILRNGRGLDNYNFLRDKDMMVMDSVLSGPQEVTIWVGEGGMFDVSNPDTRAWYGNRYRELTDEGVGGWWGDLGEPEVHPVTGRHANGLTARQYHNQYGNDWSSIISELFDSVYPSTRLMTMMRGGTTGLQRYAVYPWSTDVSRSWGGLQPQVNIMKHSGLSGLGYMSHDVGGFAVDPANPTDSELYVRWLQLGTFSPIMRTHAQFNAEPYHYPEYASIIQPLVKERYRWLPYNYTLAAQNAYFGQPLVRPLGYDTDQVARYADVADQYMWGRDVMVAPVLQQGATSRSIVFPDGEWIDYNHPEKTINGGVTIADYPAPLEELPMFIRAGAIIPTADYHMENTGDYDPNRLTLNVYCPSSIYERIPFSILWEDDFTTPTAVKHNYPTENRAYTYAFSLLDDDGNMVLELEQYKNNILGHTFTATKKVDVVMHNVNARPKAVKMVAGGKSHKLKYTYDAATRTLTIRSFEWKPEAAVDINIEF